MAAPTKEMGRQRVSAPAPDSGNEVPMPEQAYPDSRVCRTCGETKLLTEFYRHPTTQGGREKRCKACHRRDMQANKTPLTGARLARRRRKAAEYQRRRYARIKTDPEALAKEQRYKREYNRKRRAEPEFRERQRQTARRYWARKYGLTVEEWDVILAQGCAICGPTVSDRKLHLDHDHKNGKVRAALCPQHNMGLGCFADNVEHLRAAADYIEQWTLETNG